MKGGTDAATKLTPKSGLVALLCSMAAASILAFLISFGSLESCSRAKIVLFLVLLAISAVLVLVGTVAGGISYRRGKNRLALFSLLFSTVYAALLLYLIRLMS